jgi:exodeoxyribonuclease V
MTTNTLDQAIGLELSFLPNREQLAILNHLSCFLSEDCNDDFFILYGPAGSGKTSLIKAAIDYLNDTQICCHVAAPTGRAARVIAEKTGACASTLHKLLFKTEFNEKLMQITFKPRNIAPLEKPAVYVIDEASMIDDTCTREGMFVQNTSLLQQIFSYVKQGHPKSKVILLGDRYQLPPINNLSSPALSADYLKQKFNLKGSEHGLKIVERQKSGSYILENAGRLLEAINTQKNFGTLYSRNTFNFSNGIKQYLQSMQDNDADNSIMIAYANAHVNALNAWARKFRYNYKNKFTVMPGEEMICNRNSEIGDSYLHKGSSFTVLKSFRPEKFADINFINAKIVYTDIDGAPVETEVKIMEDSVTSVNGSITWEQEKNLMHEAFRTNKIFRESRKYADDPYVNAIRARYGYAMTCHKAQGGEWNNVFVHPGYQQSDYRWLYTAVTRAKQNLYSWPNNN